MTVKLPAKRKRLTKAQKRALRFAQFQRLAPEREAAGRESGRQYIEQEVAKDIAEGNVQHLASLLLRGAWLPSDGVAESRARIARGETVPLVEMYCIGWTEGCCQALLDAEASSALERATRQRAARKAADAWTAAAADTAAVPVRPALGAVLAAADTGATELPQLDDTVAATATATGSAEVAQQAPKRVRFQPRAHHRAIRGSNEEPLALGTPHSQELLPAHSYSMPSNTKRRLASIDDCMRVNTRRQLRKQAAREAAGNVGCNDDDEDEHDDDAGACR